MLEALEDMPIILFRYGERSNPRYIVRGFLRRNWNGIFFVEGTADTAPHRNYRNYSLYSDDIIVPGCERGQDTTC